MKLVQASFGDRKDEESSFHHCKSCEARVVLLKCQDRESSFHQCGGPVKFVQGCFSAGKVRQSRFKIHGCPEKFVQACLGGRKD